MRTFQPSYLNYEYAGYGDAGGRDQGIAATPPPYVDVRDVPGGTFRVKSNKVIEVLTGPGTGTLFQPGNAVYDQVLKNLMDVGGNRSKIELVLGAGQVAASLASPPVMAAAPSGQPGKKEETDINKLAGGVPFYQHKYFWPGVILAASGVAVGGIIWWARR
jgi:hypothetical protein